MPELIDKAKVLKYLTPRIKTETPYGEGYNKALEDSAALVTLMPTIEAEPVIRCKDCAFWESKRVSCEGLARCRTGESGCRYRFGHDFCSRAQRR